MSEHENFTQEKNLKNESRNLQDRIKNTLKFFKYAEKSWNCD